MRYCSGSWGKFLGKWDAENGTERQAVKADKAVLTECIDFQGMGKPAGAGYNLTIYPKSIGNSK